MDKRFLMLTASPLEQDSVSFRMADVCERAIREAKPGAELIRRDLNQLALPPMTRELINHFNLGKSSLDQAIIEVIDGLYDEFMAADRYIFAMPHWNLCVPPAMLNYSLCTMRAGSAFKYTEAGPVGLLKNKRALILLASGGVCETDDPIMRCYGVDWLKGILGLCGVSEVDVIYAQGMEARPDQTETIIEQALKETEAYIKTTTDF